MASFTKSNLMLRTVLAIFLIAAVVGLSFLVGQNIRPHLRPGGAAPAEVAADPGESGAPEGAAPGVNPQIMGFIIAKFAAWFVFIFFVALFLRRGKWQRREKLIGYGVSLLMFGVLFGPEPSPMHPVKDFIFRLGAAGTPVFLFLVSFLILLLASIILNRSVCAWGCQFGVLQDFVHRLFRNKKDTRHVISRYKPPFWFANTIRTLTFGAIIVAAFAFSYDLLGNVDPFVIFDPKAIGIGAGIFIGVIALASVLFYRPFCYFFCPFGLLSWPASRFSIIRIRIDRAKCTQCEACVSACPSNAMRGIYEGKPLPQDCYTCGSCIGSCPKSAISLSGPRTHS